jgi:hypothetical protein
MGVIGCVNGAFLMAVWWLFGPQIRRFWTANFDPNSHQISPLSEFQSAGFVTVLEQFSVAVLMAVRCQLLCILLRWIARKTWAATHSNQTTYAMICE